MKRAYSRAFILIFALSLCVMLVACTPGVSNSSASSASSSSSSSAAFTSSETMSAQGASAYNIGEAIEVIGEVASVDSDGFELQRGDVTFDCTPTTTAQLQYLSTGNIIEIEGVVVSISDNTVVMNRVYVDEFNAQYDYDDKEGDLDHDDDRHDHYSHDDYYDD